MPPLTIQQIHDAHASGILTDSSPLDEVSGIVSKAYDVKTGEYGPYQSFVLADPTGEIGVMLSGSNDKPFFPVSKGDQVRLFSSLNGKNQKGGLKKASYQNKAQLKAYNLQNANQPAAFWSQVPQGAYPAGLSMPGEPGFSPAPAVIAGAHYPTPAGVIANAGRPQAVDTRSPNMAKLSESEARRLWLRQVREVGLGLCDGATAEDVLAKLPPHAFTAICAFASGVLIGVQKGDISIEGGLADEVQGDPWLYQSQGGA